MSSLLVVGSLAYDSIKTPAGAVEKTLGGSANYFSLAASLFTQVKVVGVVGEDYSPRDKEILLKRHVDLSGVETVKGKTFHWEGQYEGDMNEAKTLKTELNVFEHFNPKLPASFSKSEFVFLANIAPELQLQVLEQVEFPKFIGMDTMNFWIHSKKDKLKEVLKKVDVILINEGESDLLTSSNNAIQAAPKIAELGPKMVVIKRGEYGFVLYSQEHGYYLLPAMPIPTVIDPTGAGDTFAGGFFGYLAQHNTLPTFELIQKACVVGTLCASFTIQDFGIKALEKMTLDDLKHRLASYKKAVLIEDNLFKI
ncbi:MAG: PfkB family carbohydrate kinase [Bdellovibrionaceae bacterium]|nr:PfkB family carbohydrate kinase [Pseudobdellovibrionaceae bacterium]NUM57482.1 sugar kinase [Pseudobdellovibrionaceae bacterium]